MSAITVTVPEHGVFRFDRSKDPVNWGLGHWVCVESFTGFLCKNMIPGLHISQMCTKIARSLGIREEGNYLPEIPRPPKAKRAPKDPNAPKARKGRPSRPGVLSGFNPFA